MREQCRKFILKEIIQDKWDYRIKEDTDNFEKETTFFSDKLGVIGDKIFDLSLDNQSSNIAYRNVSVFTGDIVAKGIINALCPELESFVTLITWMGSEEKRYPERVKSFQALNKFIKETDTRKVCRIIGNFRLKKGAYSTILPYHSEIQIQDKSKNFYEWERVPFLKRSGETIAFFPSPIFMSSITSHEKNVSEDKVAYFSAIFKIKSITNNMITIYFYNCTSPICEETDILIQDNLLLNKLKDKTNLYFIGLFEDKIFQKNNSYFREFVLLNISEELDGNDIVAYFLTQRMYYNYLKNKNLLICTNNAFENRIRRIIYQIEQSYSKKFTMPLNFFIKTYVESYFINIDNSWYYRPFILRDLTAEEFKEFIQYSCMTEQEDKLKFMKMTKKYRQYKNNLNFLDLYNFYSKRTLIDGLKKYNYEDGTSRWKMQPL